MARKSEDIELALPVAVAVPYVETEGYHSPQGNTIIEGYYRPPGNGILVGQWKSGVCECCSSIVPNCCMAWCCPCISLGQTMARIGSSGMTYMVLYGVLYLGSVGIAASSVSVGGAVWFSNGEFFIPYDTLSWRTLFQPFLIILAGIVLIVARSTIRSRFSIPGNCCCDCICSCCCSCCVLAQMATHVEAYTPGECSFGFKDTLPAYQA
ncbi:hypothetical protein Ae201684P_004978 [Aphanomyces euteiches]|uniref:Uncharacterized protein n=1 Tax=Aphanomyces euteiches TaxID=100861 RepID=A0A6G0XDG3_9STRA|nr:hypothetical protein Ae201684_006196 [Aphanomyces euteiches]KAH9069292.1 hypothetical protein Ae201684P_004978 [Aphanomyces euteiches]KAH9145850.1 hypothetical protein AeRB84_010244 [Aphanomyces euteiches]